MQPLGMWFRNHPVQTVLLSAVALPAVIVTVFYGVLAVEHGFALLANTVELGSSVLAWATTDELIFGEQGMRRLEPLYEAVPWRMAAHVSFGGLALLLGLLQFVPRPRRRHPRWHRASGMLVWLATLAAMLGALGFLSHASLHEAVSGAGFQLVLWGNALVTLFMLYQAVANAFARDFRSHMVWMAMVFASLTTAPMLRVDWVLLSYAWPDLPWDTLNLAGATFVLVLTVLAMGLWLTFIGDRDLPGRHAGNAWPYWLTWMLCAAAAGVVLHEAVLAPNGIDAWGALRPPEDRLPPVASLWAAGTIVAMLMLPANWSRVMHGQRPQARFSAAVVITAAGAVLMATAIMPASMESVACRAFWAGYALLLAVLLALARWQPLSSLNRNTWGVLLCTCLWFPAGLPGLVLIGIAAGASFAEANIAGLVIGIATPLYFGCAYAHGAKFRLLATLGPKPSLKVAPDGWPSSISPDA